MRVTLDYTPEVFELERQQRLFRPNPPSGTANARPLTSASSTVTGNGSELAIGGASFGGVCCPTQPQLNPTG